MAVEYQILPDHDAGGTRTTDDDVHGARRNHNVNQIVTIDSSSVSRLGKFQLSLCYKKS